MLKLSTEMLSPSCESDVSLKLLEVPFASALREPTNVENGRVQGRQTEGEAQNSHNACGDLESHQFWSPEHLRYLSQ